MNQRPARYIEPQVPDYNMHRLSDLLPGVLESGKRRESGLDESFEGSPSGKQKHRVRLFPTNSERMNRSLKELSKSAFKVHMLLWQWRGAPARGKLPFFTIHSLSKFCAFTRPTIRGALKELVNQGWIQKLGYSKHKKNELYRLVPIRDVPEIGARPRGPVAAAPGGADGTGLPRPGTTI